MKLHLAKLTVETMGMTNEEFGAHFRKAIASWVNDDYESLPNWAKFAANERIEKTTTYSGNKSSIVNNCEQRSTIASNCLSISSISSNLLSSESLGEEKSVEKRRGFVPPTIAEVSDYCMDRKSAIDPFMFHSYYESKGWVVGSSKMKNWQAAIRTWERKAQGTYQPHGGKVSFAGVAKKQYVPGGERYKNLAEHAPETHPLQGVAS